MSEVLNKYECFYRNKSVTIEAKTTYEAQDLASKHFRILPKNRYQITVMLVEYKGKPYVHSTASI